MLVSKKAMSISEGSADEVSAAPRRRAAMSGRGIFTALLSGGIRFDATEFVPPRMVIRLCGISRINLMVRGVLGRGS